MCRQRHNQARKTTDNILVLETQHMMVNDSNKSKPVGQELEDTSRKQKIRHPTTHLMSQCPINNNHKTDKANYSASHSCQTKS